MYQKHLPKQKCKVFGSAYQDNIKYLDKAVLKKIKRCHFVSCLIIPFMKNKMFLLLFSSLIFLFLVGLNVFHPLWNRAFLFDVKQLKKC